MFKFYPVGNPILLAQFWILHKILDRIGLKPSVFQKISSEIKISEPCMLIALYEGEGVKIRQILLT